MKRRNSPGVERVVQRPFLAVPDGPVVRYFLGLAVLQSLWFALVYVGSDQLTARRSLRLRMHFDFEEQLPFVPSAILVYSSIYLLFYSAPLILRNRFELRRLATAMAWVTLIAGCIFLLLPAERDFPYPGDFGIFAAAFRLADHANLDFNQVPSLHVGLTAVCVSAYSRKASDLGRVILWGWLIAVAVSAVLTYQHHLVDVMTGFALGVGVERMRCLDLADPS